MSLVSFSINMAQKKHLPQGAYGVTFFFADMDNLFIFVLVMLVDKGSILPSNLFFHQKLKAGVFVWYVSKIIY